MFSFWCDLLYSALILCAVRQMDKQRRWAASSLHVTPLFQLSQDESQNFLITGLPRLILPCELEHNPVSDLYNFHILFAVFFFLQLPFTPIQAALSIRNNLLSMFYIMYI